MKLLVLTAVVLLASAVTAFAADWSTAVAGVKASAVEISSAGGSCTGFVIDNVRDFVLTAAHCDSEDSGKGIYADSLKAEVKAKDEKADLMVLYVKDIDRPALKLAANDPRVGEEVASFGWGYALEQPLFRVSHISASEVALEKAHYIAIDAAFVSGQSGGPVINQAGDVVLIVQLGNEISGFGVGAEKIADKFGRFFEKK